MSEEKKWLSKEIDDTDKGNTYRCWEVVHNDDGGYVNDDVLFIFRPSGNLMIDDGGDGSILSREQVKYLRHILWENEKVRLWLERENEE